MVNDEAGLIFSELSRGLEPVMILAGVQRGEFGFDIKLRIMVIQRWQSVLLLIAAVVMAVFSFCSLGQVQLPNFTLDFTALGFSIEGESTNGAPSGFMVYTWPLLALSILTSLLPLLNIFMFKNLNLQKRLCRLEILFLFVLVCVGIVYGYYTIEGGTVSWSSVVFAPFLAIISTAMALRCIVSDHNKLRSVDRIR